jgi:hypothetical protein
MEKSDDALILSADEWYEVCEAVDHRAGGSEVAAALWPALMGLSQNGTTGVKIVARKEKA